MQGWQTPYLGLRDLPRELTEFELQAFFSFSRAELELIARRRGDKHKLGLALHSGFVRMSGRPLNSVRAVPALLLRHLGQMLDLKAPDLASLRALYARGRTLFDHQQQACEVLGFAWMTEHQRRALVRILRDEVAHSADRERLLLHTNARRWCSVRVPPGLGLPALGVRMSGRPLRTLLELPRSHLEIRAAIQRVGPARDRLYPNLVGPAN